VISGIALLVAVAALFFSLRSSDGYSEEDTSVLPPSDVPALELGAANAAASTRSLFKPPRDLESAISTALASTVTIDCGEVQGTGWAIDLENPSSGGAVPDVLTEYTDRLVTNHHVISDCVEDPGSVTARVGDQVFEAYVYSWDPKRDQAIVLTSADLAPLPLSPQPQPGWWALSVGSPRSLEGSVSIGNVMNVDGYEVIATAPMNTGNSGGPLLNAAGAVMGSTTYSGVGDAGLEPWFVSEGLPALCKKLVACTAEDLGWETYEP
jgi:putative serine protease PepD